MNDVPAASQVWLIACFAALGCLFALGALAVWLAFKSARITPPTPVKPADRTTKKDNRNA